MRTRQAGFSFIELLVAVLIMAVGILGVAGLQVVALQQNRSALFRAEANQLAMDLMDRVRVNSSQTYSSVITEEPQALTNSCVTQPCNSAAALAAYDIAQWKCSVRSVNLAGVELDECRAFCVADEREHNPFCHRTPPSNDDLIRNGFGLPMGAASVSLSSGVYSIEVRWSDDRVNLLCGTRDGSASQPLCNSLILQARLN